MNAPIVLVAGLALAVSAPTSRAPDVEMAAPRIIIVHGGITTDRHYLTDWSENLRFMQAVAAPSGPVSALALERRPYVDLALYWGGPTWEAYARDPEKLKTLSTERREAGRGRLYLAQGREPAVLVYSTAKEYRVVLASGLEILASRGVAVGGAP